MEQNSSKNKRSIAAVCDEEVSNVVDKHEKTVTSRKSSAASGSASTQQSTSKQGSSEPVFHQPPEKRPRRSFSPIQSRSKSPSSSCPGSLSSQRRANTPPIDITVPNMSRHTGQSSPSGSSGSALLIGHGTMGSPQNPVPGSPRGGGVGASAVGQVRRGAGSSLEGTGVGILRDGAGWPGFGSEEEMGMSSSGAEEDERNNKYLGFEWQWDDNAKSSSCCLAKMKTEVRFHLDYSCGTAAARGSETMRDGQFFWEVKMVSPVYGTDMMIGVCTKQVDLNQYSRAFCSMLGHEPGSESCGLSYTGRFQKGGVGHMYCSKFGQGTIIGMHLDMWFGTLTYYKDGKHLGTATRNLLSKTWYPIVSSTAARSSMRLVNTKSFPSNLQFWCCQALRKAVPPEHNVLDVVPLPPGLKNFLDDNLSWLLRAHETKTAVECKTKGTQTVLSMMSKRLKKKEESEEEDDDV